MKSTIIHPFLFAIFPILFLFSYNIDEVSGKDLIMPLIAFTIGTAILFLLFRVITKKWAEAGIATSYFLLFLFSYGHIRGLFFTDIGLMMPSPTIILLLIWTPLFIFGCFVIWRFRRDFSILTRLLNTFAIALVIVALISIGIGQFKTIDFEPEGVWEGDGILEPSNPGKPPDIYYIVLDMYAREDFLMESLNYDNSEFTDYLTSKGFYVASKSRSNYNWSLGSVASCLNMQHLESYVRLEGYTTLEEGIVNNRVSRLLKAAGYRYIYVNGGAQWKNIDKYADDVCKCTEVFGIAFSDFSYSLCETTLIAPIIKILSGVGGIITFTQYGANSIIYAFDVLATIPDIEEPTFTYAHIMCPHPPAHFTKEGATKHIVFGSDDDFYPEGYLDNLAFVTEKAKVLVDEILSKSDSPPIIILQGDHGVWFEDSEALYKILNAYHLPGEDNGVLYETITPINSFKVVFNLYFGTDYELLEDRME